MVINSSGKFFVPSRALFLASAQIFHSPKSVSRLCPMLMTELSQSIKIAALEILKLPAFTISPAHLGFAGCALFSDYAASSRAEGPHGHAWPEPPGAIRSC